MVTNVSIPDDLATKLGLQIMRLVALVGEQHREAVVATVETAIDAGIKIAIADLTAKLEERRSLPMIST